MGIKAKQIDSSDYSTNGGDNKSLVTVEFLNAKEISIGDLSDVGASTPTNRNVLVADGASFESRALVVADISDAGALASLDTVGSTEIDDDAVGNTKLANMSQSTMKGRASGAGTGDPSDLTPTQIRTILNVADGANNYSHPNHTGDVTSTGDGATVIVNDAVSNAKLANMAAHTVKVRIGGTTGDPSDLAVGTNTVLGRVAGNIVAAQVATAQVANDAITYAKMQNIASNNVLLGNDNGAGNDVQELTATEVRAILNVENGATADQSDAEIETAYNNQVSIISQVDAETGTSTTPQRWTAERVAQAIAALSSGEKSRWLEFSLAGQANSTVGLLSKASAGVANPPDMQPTTSPYSTFNNGANDPYAVEGNGTITKIILVLNSCAVSQGTVGAAPTARFDLYSHASVSRTLEESIDLEIPQASVNASNDINTNKFVVLDFDVSIALPATNEAYGIQFTNRSANNEEINGISRAMLSLKIEY